MNNLKEDCLLLLNSFNFDRKFMYDIINDGLVLDMSNTNKAQQQINTWLQTLFQYPEFYTFTEQQLPILLPILIATANKQKEEKIIICIDELICERQLFASFVRSFEIHIQRLLERARILLKQRPDSITKMKTVRKYFTLLNETDYINLPNVSLTQIYSQSLSPLSSQSQSQKNKLSDSTTCSNSNSSSSSNSISLSICNSESDFKIQPSTNNINTNNSINFSDGSLWFNSLKNIDEHLNAMNQQLFVTFQYKSFKSLQKEICLAAVMRKNIIALLPTGYGKTICYILPGLLSRIPESYLIRTTIIISPLIALIKNQIDELKAKHISCTVFAAYSNSINFKELCAKTLRSEYNFIFITPEKLCSTPLYSGLIYKLYNLNLINRFVIDEAHCISTWGHDFRPSYTKINKVFNHFYDIPITALTATADQGIIDDIVEVMNRPNTLLFKCSMNRSNLTLEIWKKTGLFYFLFYFFYLLFVLSNERNEIFEWCYQIY